MDEDQQNEEQQQEQKQDIAQSAFNVFQRLNTTNQRRLNSFTLFNRQNKEANEETRQAVRQNELAISTINTSLVSITSQVVQLSSSLKMISEKMQQSTLIESARQAQEKRQEALLNDENARRGAEGQLEQRIQGALFAPIQKIGQKTQFTLARLVRFFNILLGGFLAGRALTLIRALTTGNQEALKGMGESILKQLTAASGIFIAINGGLVIAIRSLANLSGFLTRLAVTNLLLRPIQLVFKAASALAAAIVGTEFFKKYGRMPLTPNVPPPVNNIKNTKNKPPYGGLRASLFQVGLLSTFDLISGENPYRVGGGFAGGLVGSQLQTRLGNLLIMQPNPLLKSVGRVIKFTSFLGAGLGYEGGKEGISLLDQSLGLNLISGNTRTDTDLINQSIQNIKRGNTNVNVNLPQGEQVVDAAQGRAALLMLAPSENPNNPYIYNSYIQYNVLPVA